MLDLIIITGASKGIGNNIAYKCSNIAKHIVGIGSSESIYDVKLENKECEYLPLRLDLHLNSKSIQNRISKKVEKIDAKSIGIVLCAAQIGEGGGVLTSDLSEWESLYRCNVLGNLAVVKGCSDIIKSSKSRIVFFAGGGAAFAYPEFPGYALSKVATVRMVENLSIELSTSGYDSSVIAIAPGAVNTDMLAKAVAGGTKVRNASDISEPTNFVIDFLTDKFDSKNINGKFLHVRDDINSIDFSNANKDLFQLRRIQ